ncbi:MAG: acyltransferase [Clostridia bacterium]|nr:acyltransferase [Clostridia bacterium]
MDAGLDSSLALRMTPEEEAPGKTREKEAPEDSSLALRMTRGEEAPGRTREDAAPEDSSLALRMTRKPGRTRIPELDGLRVLMIFVVSWYHIWQQSWLEPIISVPALGIRWSLDFLVRSGYVWVDGTVLLSAFLLALPLARKGREFSLDTGDFLFRKARRLLPGFWFIILVFFLAMCLPWDLYQGNGPYMVKDLFTHFTLIFPFWRDTYIYTPLGAAPWTLAVVAQGYLLFPLLARGLRKRPVLTCALLCAGAFGFRAWCLWGLADYSMVVNTLVNFLDVYAIGFGCAFLFAYLEKKLPREGKLKKLLPLQAAATAVFFLCGWGLVALLKHQAGSPDHLTLQGNQMIYRPLFALCFAGLMLSAPFSLRPLRFLLGNRLMRFLSGVSMNYYLIHQTLAVHLKRLNFPPSAAENPNMAGEQPWQSLYTLAVFGFSLLAAILVTYLVEKPGGRLMERLRTKRKNREAA